MVFKGCSVHLTITKNRDGLPMMIIKIKSFFKFIIFILSLKREGEDSLNSFFDSISIKINNVLFSN